ncbi:lytic murein transglycosylase [Microvirga sp. 0TCS3.31]
MSSSSRLHRAIAVIPLAVLSAAWTANLAGVGVDPASADPEGSHTLPDGTVLPTAAIEAPASVGDAVTRAAALTPGSASDIPQGALSAYQRAEAVINEADEGCNLPWEVVAAIGRVESDHGRFGGNTLDDRGVARPGIFGIALNGRNDTQRILDTDAGQYDGDTRFDRAVGPMQFIPSTWSVVGVDGDNDGTRDPQDIDDAALATAVYLCSGDDDLSSEKGQRASVYRYNHSNAYVDLVLEIMQAYLDGDFSAVPSSPLTTGVIVDDPTASTGGNGGGDNGGVKGGNGGQGDDGGGKGGNGDDGDDGDKDDDSSPTKDPTQDPTKDPTQDPTQEPTQDPTVAPTGDPTTPLPTLPTTAVPTVVPTILTEAAARARCIESGIAELDVIALTACIANLLNP